MADRKAQQKYYPPDWDPSKGSLNKMLKQHPLRERAKKLDQGILVIRFEMPFNIWCGKCQRMIAKGVRFNAEKKSIGKYFTTTIWEFRMKCPSCSQLIVIVTDPKNCEYEVVSGGQRKVEDYNAEDVELVEFMDDETRERINQDPMFALELRGEDKRKADIDSERISGLMQMQNQMLDDYSVRRKMRATFRSDKKTMAEEEKASYRSDISTKLLPVSDSDKHTSQQIWFGKTSQKGLDVNRRLRKLSAKSKPLMSSNESRKHKALSAAIRHSVDVSRLALAPEDAVKKESFKPKLIISKLKRIRRNGTDHEDGKKKTRQTLVQYDSSSSDD